MKILMEQWKKYLTEGEDKAIWKGYLGWKVPADKVSLDGVDQKYIDNRITRDGEDSFHITIFTPPEVRGMIKDKIEDLIEKAKKEKRKPPSKNKAKKEAKEKLMNDAAAALELSYEIGDTKSVEGPGDGSVGEKGSDSIAFFKTVKWDKAQEFRAEYRLPPKDFHITLGIGDNGDVHGVDKT
jgi:hypothetical protein